MSEKKQTSLYTFTAKVVNKMKVFSKTPATTAYVDTLLGFRGFASLCEFSFIIKRRKKGGNVEKRKLLCRTITY